MVDSKAAKELAIKLKNCGIMTTMSKELLHLRKQKKTFLRYLNLSICHINWKKISLQMIFHSYWKF